MNRETYHLDLGLELDLPSNGISVFQSLNRDHSPVLKDSFVDMSEPAFPKNVLAAEVLGCHLKFSEIESP